MLRSLTLYLRQRYKPQLFLALAAFLVLFAGGATWRAADAIAGGAVMLLLLFWFRLYDDLASREIDAGRPDRAYTDASHARSLRALVVPLAVGMIATVAAVDITAAALLVGFLVVQELGYQMLFRVGRWRTILPLLKYPVLAAIVRVAFGPDEPIQSGEVAACLALLPAFVLFESLDDDEFAVKRPVAALLFVAACLLLAPTIGVEALVLTSIGLAIHTALAAARQSLVVRVAPYLLLVFFLLLRVRALDQHL